MPQARHKKNARSDLSRLSFLDGLRGWGALFVLLGHVFVQNFPTSSLSAEWLNRIFIFNGPVAVYVFFAVSGYALSVSFARTRSRAVLARIITGRYFRLGVPVVIGCVLLYICVWAGLILTPARSSAASDPTVVALFAFVGAFFTVPFPTTAPIPQLWTMPIELLGSVVVVALLWFFGFKAWRGWVYGLAALASAAYMPVLVPFVVGVVLAETQHKWPAPGRWAGRLAAFGLILGFVLVAAIPTGQSPLAMACIGSLLTASASFWPAAKSFLSCSVSRFLGGISFPLYITHGIVIHSFGVWANRGADSPIGIVVANLATVALAIVVGWVFRWSDAAGVHASHLAARWLLPSAFQRRPLVENEQAFEPSMTDARIR